MLGADFRFKWFNLKLEILKSVHFVAIKLKYRIKMHIFKVLFLLYPKVGAFV